MSTFRQKVQANTDWGKPDPVEEAPPRGGWKARTKAADTAGTPSKRAGQRRLAAPAPVTSHRLFPAFAALWFAALFGLGSLAISSEVLGKLVVALGLPALVPAAAPPLGFTAHLLVALALTVVGAALGLVLGLRLRPQTANATAGAARASFTAEPDDTALPKVRARDAHPDAPPRRPLVLTEAFADPAQSQIEEPNMPADALLGRKPADQESAAAESAPDPWFPVYTPGGSSALEPLDLAALDFPAIEESSEPVTSAAPNLSSELETDTSIVPEAVDVEDELAIVALAVPAVAITAEPIAALSDEFAEPARPVLLAATPQMASGFTLPLPDPAQRAAGEAWSPVASAPLASLGLVQLIERLALAIAARKAADDAGPPPAVNAVTPGSEEAGIDGHESEVPASGPAVDPISTSEPEAFAEEALGPFSRPIHPQIDPTSKIGDEPPSSAREAILRRLGVSHAQVPASAGAAIEASSQSALEAGPAPFSRPAEPPVKLQREPDAVLSLRKADWQPSAALATVPAAPETDEALRSALATLQRMSARN